MSQTNINPEVLCLVKTQLNAVEDSISSLTSVLNALIDEEDKALLTEIILVKKKHTQMLAEVIYRLTGEKYTPASTPQNSIQYEILPAKEFRKYSLAEINDAETYRSLVFDFLTWSLRDTFTELMTDSQNNSTRFALLLTKYS